MINRYTDVTLGLNSMMVRGAPAIGIAAAYALALVARDEQGDENAGQGELHIGDTHGQGIAPAADIAGDHAQADAQGHGEGHGAEANDER